MRRIPAWIASSLALALSGAVGLESAAQDASATQVELPDVSPSTDATSLEPNRAESAHETLALAKQELAHARAEGQSEGQSREVWAHLMYVAWLD